MTETPHYPNAPIVEAIFDIQTALPLIPTQEQFTELAKGIVGDAYSSCSTIRCQNIELVQGSAELNVKSNDDWIGCEFRQQDLPQVLRIRKDGMSFHRLHPYTSYEELIPQFRKLWESYLSTFSPKAVTKVSLRFINRINLPAGSKIVDLSKFVKVVPHVALPVETDIQNLLSRVHIVEKGTNNNAHVSFSSVKKGEDLENILLDIETWNSLGAAADSSEIWDSFEGLRDLKNTLFTGSLEEECLSLFK